LDAPIRISEGATKKKKNLHDLLPDERIDLDGEVMDREQTEVITEVLGELDDREREVLERLFGLNGYAVHTLEEIGGILGYTREGTRLIKVKALNKLRYIGRRRRLEPFWKEG